MSLSADDDCRGFPKGAARLSDPSPPAANSSASDGDAAPTESESTGVSLDLTPPLRRAPRSFRTTLRSRSPGALVIGALLSALVFAGLKASASEEPAPPPPIAAVPPPEAAAVAPVIAAPPVEPPAPLASEEKLPAKQAIPEISEGEGTKPIVIDGVPNFSSLKPLAADLDFVARAREEDGKLVVDTAAGKRTLTINPTLQKSVTELIKRYRIPFGAVTAMDPRTGKILAMAEYSEENPKLRGLNLRAIYPAASVFKVVTGSALLDAGVSPDETVCYHGGSRRIQKSLLKDDGRRDGRCITMSQAMSHSANVVFGKLASRELDAKKLQLWANRYGFNAAVPFAEPIEPSPAAIPEDAFDFATTAAGFGKVFLSPIHGAILAGIVGTRGSMVTPVLFEDDKMTQKQVLESKLANTIADMLERTVTDGTARRSFRERGRYALPVPAAGKTGTLASQGPYREFSWFVGWAPKDNPTIAVAAVMVNGLKWTIRAPYIVRETMRMYLDPPKKKAPRPLPLVKAKKGPGGKNKVAAAAP